MNSRVTDKPVALEFQVELEPTYDAESGNRTRATLVGGERSHHCAIPAPSSTALKLLK